MDKYIFWGTQNPSHLDTLGGMETSRAQTWLLRPFHRGLPHIQRRVACKQNHVGSVMLSTPKGLCACSGKVKNGLCECIFKDYSY